MQLTKVVTDDFTSTKELGDTLEKPPLDRDAVGAR
jgi:hypothetical protein